VLPDPAMLPRGCGPDAVRHDLRGFRGGLVEIDDAEQNLLAGEVLEHAQIELWLRRHDRDGAGDTIGELRQERVADGFRLARHQFVGGQELEARRRAGLLSRPGVGLKAGEVVMLPVSEIDSKHKLIHVEQGNRREDRINDAHSDAQKGTCSSPAQSVAAQSRSFQAPAGMQHCQGGQRL
jgi:hypothetical protein